MELFKETHIDFMGLRRYAAVFSFIIFFGSILSLFVYGLHMGLDFTGGTQIEVTYEKPADLDKIREQLKTAGFNQAVVQSYGTTRDVLISIGLAPGLDQQQLSGKVLQALPGAQKQRVDAMGAQVSSELATKGVLAVMLSLLATMIYIAMRFEYRFAVSSTVALIHDPILILGMFSFFQLEFDLKALAALLTVIGYSLNDTIVVFDRVRENFRKLRKATPIEIMNLSINQTLSRTIMTSALTFIVVTVLFLYGGETLRGFSLSLIIGIVIGTYSSIYVAGALAIAMGLNKKDLMPTPKEVIDERQ